MGGMDIHEDGKTEADLLRCQLLEVRTDLDSVKSSLRQQGATCTKLMQDVAHFQAALEHSGVHFDSRIDELKGTVAVVDQEQGVALKGLQEWRAVAEQQLSVLSSDLHKIGATVRGDLRRVSEEVDRKLREPVRTFNAEMNGLEARLKGEMRSVRDKQDGHASDTRGWILNLEQQMRTLRQQTEQMRRDCIQHTDDCQAALSRELEENVAAINNEIVVQSEAAHRNMIEATAESKIHAEGLHTAITGRHEDLSTVVATQHVELQAGIAQAQAYARETAQVSTEAALNRVDDHLQAFVTKSSVTLMARIDAVSNQLRQDGELTKHGEFLALQEKELEGGFLALLARDAVDTDLRIMVDRAATRLQAMSDDIAQRSWKLQEQILFAEQRMQACADGVERRANEIEARVDKAIG